MKKLATVLFASVLLLAANTLLQIVVRKIAKIARKKQKRTNVIRTVWKMASVKKWKKKRQKQRQTKKNLYTPQGFTKKPDSN